MISLLMVLCIIPGTGDAQQKAKTSKKPNIIIILADDLGYGDLKKLNPDAQIETPNLTRLANNGLIFTNAHTPSAVCTPTRYGLLTGRYCFRSILKQGVLRSFSPALIEDDRCTIADVAKNAGYSTAVIGKWHLGINWKPIDASKPAILNANTDTADVANANFKLPYQNGPHTIGFDYSYIIPASADMAPYSFFENGLSVDYPFSTVAPRDSERGVFYRGGYASPSFKFEETLDHFITKTNQYIADQSKKNDQPFFLYLPLTSPHTPWFPGDKFKGKSGAGLYGDFVMHTDDAVGRVMHCLDSLKLTENTIVIFTSDNGADWRPQDQKKYPAHQANYISRGQKADIWDGGHHVPLLISWPGKLAKNKEVKEIICLTDFMATLAGFTGQKLPENAGPDSFDFSGLIFGNKKISRPDIIHHSMYGMFAIRKDKWKFIDGKGSGGWSEKNLKTDIPGQLYDMEKDEKETTNLYHAYPEVVKELKQLLDQQKEQGYSVKH